MKCPNCNQKYNYLDQIKNLGFSLFSTYKCKNCHIELKINKKRRFLVALLMAITAVITRPDLDYLSVIVGGRMVFICLLPAIFFSIMSLDKFEIK